MGQPHHHPAVLPIRLSGHSHDRCGCFLCDSFAPDNTVPYNMIVGIKQARVLSVILLRKEAPMNFRATDSVHTAPAPNQRTYRVEEIASLLGIGRTSAYNLI